jgi:hypothetical protein
MGATAALTILSKLFLATLFARHVVLPSALQTLDWARSTLFLDRKQRIHSENRKNLRPDR